MIDSIILENVNKKYKGTKIIHAVVNVSLRIKKGEFFCLVGPSGCGKSTILKLIAGLEYPTSGKIIKPDKIGMVFQSGALLPWLTVEENVDFGPKMNGLNENKIKERTTKNLQMVSLEELRKKYPRELSGGQRQRVGIARALAIEPDVLLLDEPFSALDTLTTSELHEYLLKIWRVTNKTIVMVSHLLEEAVLLSDRIGVMKEGEIKDIVEVNFPRPRIDKEKEFSPLVDKIRKILSN